MASLNRVRTSPEISGESETVQPPRIPGPGRSGSSAGSPEEEEPQPVPKPPTLDFCIDAGYILGDFRRCYGIDLRTADYLHWWEFLALLRALPDDSCTMRRVGYRSVDLNEITDKRQRAQIAKIQRQIALPFEFDDEMIGAMMWNA